MKNVLRDWLGINEEKLQLELQIEKLQDKIEVLSSGFDSELSNFKYELEDKVSEYDVSDIVRDVAYYDIDDIKNDLDSETDTSEIVDTVFDLVMHEIEDRDTLQELVEQKLEALTDEGRNNLCAYPDITEVVEDVVEELINKLRA